MFHDPRRLAGLRRALTTVGDVAAPAAPRPDHPWAFVDSAAVDVAAVRAAAVEFDAAVAELPASGVLADTLRTVRGPGDLAALLALADRSGVGVPVLDETRSERWRRATDAISAQIAAFAAAAHPGLEVATPAAIDLPLADLHAQAQAAAASSWFGRKKRLKAVRDQLVGVLRPGADVEPAAVPELVAALLQVQGAACGAWPRRRPRSRVLSSPRAGTR